MNLHEFLNLTLEETEIVLEFCKEEIELRSEEMDKLHEDSNNIANILGDMGGSVWN